MKKYILLISFSFLSLKLMAANLTVVVKDLVSKQGQVLVALYNNKNSFPIKGQEYKSTKVYPITNTTISVKFNNLPSGEYAIAVLHDKDKSGDMSKNLLGLPLEPYGFSNYKKFGKPSFDQAKFRVGTKDVVVTINLKNNK
ncbi:MAG: DUF2141 domain-containing protein [Neisseriaceae bacterium]